jgi:hypothetical protein
MDKEDQDLVICVFGCDTIEQYQNEIQNILHTWGKKAKEYPNVKVLYFLGEEHGPLVGPEFIRLPNVSNDYLSASYKQFLGLKHIKEQYSPKFILCCGTDTYLNIPKLLAFLEIYNPFVPLYIGGHGDVRKIGQESYFFHSGGPGFMITSPFLDILYPKLDCIMNEWTELCVQNNVTNLIPACDVAVGYYAKKMGARIVKTNDLSFIHCNYWGYPCHQGEVKIEDIISCHSMSSEDFQAFTWILEENRYFCSG